MTPAEFRSWTEYHGSAFPDWAAQAVEAMRANGGTRDAWYGQMVGITLEAARQATDDMLAGRIRRPFAADEHIPAIRARASAIVTATMPLRDTRENTFRCPVCQDTGFVTVMHPSTVKRCQAGEYDAFVEWQIAGAIGRPPARPKWYTCALWCDCLTARRQREKVADAGRSDARQNAWALMPVFVSGQHVKASHNASEMILEAKEVRPANYVTDFDHFNAQAEEAGF